MLRPRDFAAALAVFVLAKLASEDPSDSLAATVQLSFYVGREDTSGGSAEKVHRLALAPVVLDVDGDGTVEALASVLHDQKSDTWKLEVLDLKPAASTDKTHMAPFRPKALYQSDPISFTSGLKTKTKTTNNNGTPLLPIQLATGHVALRDRGGRKVDMDVHTMTHYKNVELNDRNRHYFCGNDWHHASQQCSVPCPEGTVSECPEGQHCYADTPCDIANIHRQDVKINDKENDLSFSVNDLLVTPAGGLPSIFSLWSNGVLSMHSLTGDFPSNSTTTKSIKRSKAKELIGIRQMWESQIVAKTDVVPQEWTGVSLTYVDATDSSAESGIVVVQAHLTHLSHEEEEGEETEQTLIMAFDAETGKKIWDVSHGDHDEDGDDEDNAILLPLTNSLQSRARRRSLKPLVRTKKSQNTVSNCLHAYRRSILTSEGILPFLYWDESDTSTNALHFEQQEHNQHLQANKKIKNSGGASTGGLLDKTRDFKKSSWKEALSPFNRKRRNRDQRFQPKRGKPNVIASKSEKGIEVRSLKNGRSVCHLSLWEETLYTDLNHDGVLDGIYFVSGDHIIHDDDKVEVSEDEKWVWKLVGRLKDSKMLSEVAGDNAQEQQLEDQSQRLCHLMALSGVPVKEELFSINLCGNNLNDQTESPDPAPYMVVESAYGKEKDIIIALNDKTVHRFRGKSGRRMWQLNGKLHEDFPSWENGYITQMGRIETPNVALANRPMLLVGDSSMALISPGHGKVLATAALPQPSIRRPILVDFNGDGTTDVLVVTHDAVWGYRVTISAGSSILFRITVGLLVVGIMLAILKNRFGPHPGKRSTDS
ncbi:hypothetical protein ACA910_010713 [Epithemia clementina (nom. ined.)]